MLLSHLSNVLLPGKADTGAWFDPASASRSGLQHSQAILLGAYCAFSRTMPFAVSAARRESLNAARYMIRAPMSLEKMSYDPATGIVIYRSKTHVGLKRNFQVMPGAQWLELLCKHIPDRHEHLVRYVGWYSNRARGERAKVLKAQQPTTMAPAAEATVSEFATRAKATWARLIHKVYEADPLVCLKFRVPCA